MHVCCTATAQPCSCVGLHAYADKECYNMMHMQTPQDNQLANLNAFWMHNTQLHTPKPFAVTPFADLYPIASPRPAPQQNP